MFSSISDIRYEAEPTRVYLGENVTLQWTFQNAQKTIKVTRTSNKLEVVAQLFWGNVKISNTTDGILTVNNDDYIVSFTFTHVSFKDAGLYSIQGHNDAKLLSADDKVLFIWGRSRHLFNFVK